MSELVHPAYGKLREVTPFASVMLAHNPTPMTLDGTNTWLLRAPGSPGCVVVDPGPGDEAHLKRVAEHGPVEQVLLTHWHPDHTAGARRFAELTGASVRALDPELCIAAEPLGEGAVIAGGGLEMRVLATPGHTSDSVCLLVEHGGVKAVLTGDTVLGRGTTVVAHPDGRLGGYLESLQRLAALPEGTSVLPGHGPELPDVGTVTSVYLAHRERRLEQVRGVVRMHGPDVTARQVVDIVYADVDYSVRPAAESSVQAQLTYLHELGEL